MSKIFRCVNEVERRKLYNNSSPGGNFFYFRRLFLKYKNNLPTVKLDPEDEKLCKSMDRAKTPKDYKKIDNKIKLLKKQAMT